MSYTKKFGVLSKENISQHSEQDALNKHCQHKTPYSPGHKTALKKRKPAEIQQKPVSSAPVFRLFL